MSVHLGDIAEWLDERWRVTGTSDANGVEMAELYHDTARITANVAADEVEIIDPFTSCDHPGRYGCGQCDACACWGDDEYHRLKDEGYY